MPFDYDYHNSTTRQNRLKDNECRCSTNTEGRTFRLHDLIRGDVVIDPEDQTSPLTTQAAPSTRPESIGLPPRHIYAISKSYEIRIAPDGVRKHANSVKHESLFHNDNVLAARELGFDQGILSTLNDHSGSYNTDGELEAQDSFAGAVLMAVDMHGIPISETLRSQLNDLRERFNV